MNSSRWLERKNSSSIQTSHTPRREEEKPRWWLENPTTCADRITTGVSCLGPVSELDQILLEWSTKHGVLFPSWKGCRYLNGVDLVLDLFYEKVNNKVTRLGPLSTNPKANNDMMMIWQWKYEITTTCLLCRLRLLVSWLVPEFRWSFFLGLSLACH